ncbi:Uncharacterised protein [Escherichia coli]|nr:Uncharacterised protein [Escherichia coli]
MQLSTKHPVHKAELTFVTNEDGIVTVPSLHIGQWLAKVQNKKSFQDKSLCDENCRCGNFKFLPKLTILFPALKL